MEEEVERWARYIAKKEQSNRLPASLPTRSKGVYTCAACGNELFISDMKFDSHCGLGPSFRSRN